MKTQTKQRLSKQLSRWANAFFLAAMFALPFSKAVLELFLAASFISWFLFKTLSNGLFSSSRKVTLFAGLFIISSSISAFYSGYPFLSIRGAIKIIKYVLAMLVAADLYKNGRRLKHLLVVVIISFSFLIIDSIYQRFVGKDLVCQLPIHYTDLQIRLTGPYVFYGLLGANLIAVLPVLISVIMVRVDSRLLRWKNVLLVPLFLVSLYVLYKTHSRSAWAAAIGSWAFYAYLNRNKLILGIVISLIAIAPFTLPRNALIHLDIEKQEQSLFERYRLWERAIQVIAQEPFFGCGINTYVKNYPKYDRVKNWRVPGYYVHNGYLQMAAETGLISLGLFLLLIANGVQDAMLAIKKSANPEKTLMIGALSGFVALLLQASMDTTLHNLQAAILIWTFLGILFAFREFVSEGKPSSYAKSTN